MAFRRLFDDKFIGERERQSDYRKWSERAIIVGFNGDTQTYDIVITIERLAGVSKRTLNKTIRNVKSTIPASTVTFSPGDSVLVGYVSEKREHPIIIGGGGTVVQDAAVVTIGGATSEVEGGGSELEGSENFATIEPLSIFDSVTGSSQTLLLDCAEDPTGLDNGFFTHVAQAAGGVSGKVFTISTLEGCDIPTQTLGNLFKIKPPSTSGSGIAYVQMVHQLRCLTVPLFQSPILGCDTVQDTGFCPGFNNPSPPAGCVENECPIGAGRVGCCLDGGVTFGPSPTFTPTYFVNNASVVYTVRRCSDSIAFSLTSDNQGQVCADAPVIAPTDALGKCGSCGPSTGLTATSACNRLGDLPLPDGPAPGSVSPLAQQLDKKNWGLICDARSQTTKDTGTCCPCSLLSGLIVTVTDSVGQNVSIIISVF